MKLKVLVIQNNAIIGNKKATLNNIETLLERYQDQSFDIIVFPEVFAIGWYCKNFIQEAEDINNSETIRFLQNIARDFNALVIGGTFIQKLQNGTYKNTCPVIQKNGKLVTTYDKMHLFSHKGSEENKFVDRGKELKILDLGYTKIGLSVCYDIRFPEIYRTYSRAGAEILINTAAWSVSKPEHWDIMHKARAIENQCFMIVADQTGKIKDNEYNLGHSMVIDPWGNVLAELQEEESCITCEVDTQQAKELRANFPLLSDRRDNDFNMFKYEEIKSNE